MSAKGLNIGRRDFLKASGLTAAAAAFTTCVGAGSAPKADACDLRKIFPSKKQSTPEIVFDVDNPIVQTTAGKVRGFIDNGIYTFRGIPYAEADRFEEPHAPTAWDGVRNCVTYGGACPQSPFVIKSNWILYQKMYWVQEENCQKLNVWTADVTAKKPVMVWIHGGAYSTGYANGQYCNDGRSLCDKGDVVVVSINHRLNCLGYLDLSAYGEAYRYSGNAGMLDIIAALQWVQDNIARFGGDPDNVTVFGQSGGGCKIMNLLCMPLSKGLFHKCIVQSGRNAETLPEDAKLVAKKLFEELGIAEGNVDELKKVEYDRLRVAGDAALSKAGKEVGRSLMWSSVMDGEVQSANAWTAASFPERGNEIPMIIGTVFGEMTSNAMDMLKNADYEKNTWDSAKVDAKLTERYGDKKDAVVTAFQKAYPNKPIVDALYVDMLYRGDTKKAIETRARTSAPLYTYMFSYEFPTLGGLLPTHCSDLPFVFGNVSKHGTLNGATEEGHKLESIMLGVWSAFAHTGDPNHAGMIDWPAYTTETGATMLFEPECQIGYHHDDELMNAFNG